MCAPTPSEVPETYIHRIGRTPGGLGARHLLQTMGDAWALRSWKKPIDGGL